MKINIAFFFGGKSVEHEISVISALQAMAATDKSKYTVTPIYISKEGNWYTGDELLDVENYKNIKKLLQAVHKVSVDFYGEGFEIYRPSFMGRKSLAKIDVAFPVLHGTNGEDGVLQGFFELKNIPYVGSNVLGSAIGMDKVIMKMVLKENDIPTVDYVWFTDKEWHLNRAAIVKKIKNLGFPVIIKPANLGSSIGISQAKDEQELKEAIEMAGNFSTRILVETMVTDLREINCSVMGSVDKQEASVCEEPLRSGEILTYDDKYNSNAKGEASKGMESTQRIIPAKIPDELTVSIQEMAKKTFKVLNSSGVARLDFLIDNATNKVYVNEINSIPGSLSFYLWEATGKPFETLIDDLVNVALRRHQEQDNYMMSYNQNIFTLSGDALKMGKGKG